MNELAPPRLAVAPGLTGEAFIALWNDVEPAREAEYDAWHTQEHVPQRVGIAGILSGRRYVADAEALQAGEARYFTLYDLQGPEVLDSPAYLAVVQSPTAWSFSMRPSLLNFVRLPCHRQLSLGGGIGGAIATIRVPSNIGVPLRGILARLCGQAGIVAAHWGEPCRDAQPFPLGNPAGEGGLLLVEGTTTGAIRAALSGMDQAFLATAACYTLAFTAAQPARDGASC